MCLSTQRMTQPSSREVRDLLSKPLTHESKHCWTRLEYICNHQFTSHKEGCISLNDWRRTFMNSFICFFSMRFWSSRCSVCESLRGVSCP